MMKEIQQVAKGVTIGGQNCTDLRYADDAVFISDQVVELQKTLLITSVKCVKTLEWN